MAVVGRAVLSFLSAQARGWECLLRLHLHRLLAETDLATVWAAVTDPHGPRRLVELLSQAGCCSLAVSLGWQASELWQGRVSGDQPPGGLSGPLHGEGSLSLFEVALLHAARTLNFHSLQMQAYRAGEKGPQLLHDVRVVCGDLFARSQHASTAVTSSCITTHFEECVWRQLSLWLGLVQAAEGPARASHLFKLCLSCILQLDPQQPIPTSFILRGSLPLVVAIYTRYGRLHEACQLAVQDLQQNYDVESSGHDSETALERGKVNPFFPWRVYDDLVLAIEKEIGDSTQDTTLYRSFCSLKQAIKAHFHEIVIAEI